MFFSNIDLARRIEASEALGAAACAAASQRANPSQFAAALEIAGGCACFTGADSPLTQVLGIGVRGPVSEGEMDQIEEFFRQRECAVAIDLCPLADITLLEILRKRGYRIVEFTNMLVHRIGEEPLPESAVRIREAGEGDIDLWSTLLWQGFVGTEELTREARELGATLFHSEPTRTLIACLDDVPAGSAEFAMSSGVASFFCDSTLPAFRNRGVQNALIRYRLRLAAEAGCDLAIASALPGSGSHANYFRAGFEVAYTRAKMIREFVAGA